jgi:hypothetical protein
LLKKNRASKFFHFFSIIPSLLFAVQSLEEFLIEIELSEGEKKKMKLMCNDHG